MIDRRTLATCGLATAALALQALAAPLRAFAQGRTKTSKANTMPGKGERKKPLFLSEEDARTIIHDHCVEGWDDPLLPAQINLIVSRLRPQLWLAAADGAGEIGATRFGGAPDMPHGASWPMRAAMPDRARSAAAGRTPNPWIVRQHGETVPFEFVAQIDLAEAARHPAHATGLPQTGRLLVFIDDALLMDQPQGNRDACRVIFDETPPGNLSRLDVPGQFEEMEAWWRTPDPQQIVHIEQMARDLEAAGQKEAAKAMKDAATSSATDDTINRKPFVYPARAMKLEAILALPNESAIEVGMDADLKRLVDDDEAGEHYRRLTANDIGPFTTDPDDMRVSQPWLMREARRNRLMGAPQPEQGDPRFDAIPQNERPPYPWNAEQAAASSRKAAEWQMLLQVSVADLSQQQREGTLYVMVRKDDLARRDFSRALVTYQQT